MPPLFDLRRARTAFAGLVTVARLLLSAAAFAQSVPPATNLAALTAYPDFYVDRTIVVRAQLRDVNGRLSLEDDAGHHVIAVRKSREPFDAAADVTGVLWDLGRMRQDDGRLAGYDLASVVGVSGEWPRPGQVLVFAASKVVPTDPASATTVTIRSLVLDGGRSDGRQVTVVGQFGGRNLFGDLPRSPGLGRWDFVIRSGGAAIWVTGMQPRGKDFDFDPDKRIDSNRWLQVTGTVREERGLLAIQATRLALSKGDANAATDAVAPAKAMAPAAPPQVLFSVPTEGETDVAPTVVVRIQLSRTIDRTSLVNHVRAGYVPRPGGQMVGLESTVDLEERNDAPAGAIAVLVIRFAQPLERFRAVRVELLDGIKAPDGQPLKSFQLTFTVGAQ
jgi:hypothetical protein